MRLIRGSLANKQLAICLVRFGRRLSVVMQPENRPRQQEQILSQEAAGTVVLFNLDDGQYFALNEVGGRLWELCNGSNSVAQIVSTISEEFDAPPETVIADVMELLDDLAKAKLVAEVS